MELPQCLTKQIRCFKKVQRKGVLDFQNKGLKEAILHTELPRLSVIKYLSINHQPRPIALSRQKPLKRGTEQGRTPLAPSGYCQVHSQSLHFSGVFIKPSTLARLQVSLLQDTYKTDSEIHRHLKAKHYVPRFACAQANATLPWDRTYHF